MLRTLGVSRCAATEQQLKPLEFCLCTVSIVALIIVRHSETTHAALVTALNPTPISIPADLGSFGPSSPYPSIINFGPLEGLITDVTVHINDFSHDYTPDVGVLLVGPDGQNVVLLNGAGGPNFVSQVSLTFSDAASEAIGHSPISSGAFLPDNSFPERNLQSPAPAGPYGTSLSIFNGTEISGDWKLFVFEFDRFFSGFIFGGWSLDIRYSSGQTFWVNNGVADWNVGANWSNSVPNSNTGAEINNGGTVILFDPQVASGVILGASNSGTLEVIGGRLDAGGYVFVGKAGMGTLSVQNSGQVSSAAGYIGYDYDATGTVTVDGVGSSWVNRGKLNIGHEGSGTLNVTGGGTVSTNGQVEIGFGGDSISVVTVADANSTWTNNGKLIVGGFGEGSLNIIRGGGVSSTTGSIGNAAHSNGSSTGTVTVDGAGSTWTNNGSLIVANQGIGTLWVAGGGGVSNTNGYIGYDYDSTGTVTVDGAGSNWINNGKLNIGHDGSGTLNITGGGGVSTIGQVEIGYGVYSVSAVTVADANSTWTNNGKLIVGGFGEGSLNIIRGGGVSSTTGSIGNFAYSNGSSTGTVTVDGAGSTWTSNGILIVGNQGAGTLKVTGGGRVSNTNAIIGFDVSSNGTVSVDGPQSTWTNSGELTVGDKRTGTLRVTDGGNVSNINGYIGRWDDLFARSNGSVTVDGDCGRDRLCRRPPAQIRT
jgi:T5SS/PEP-CTERM-associated repeat protein